MFTVALFARTLLVISTNPDCDPAGMMIEFAARVAAAVLEFWSVTVTWLGAGMFRLTIRKQLSPPVTMPGMITALAMSGTTVRLSDRVTLESVALIETFRTEVTRLVVIRKRPLRLPAGIVIVAGTVAAVVSLDES